MSFSLLNIIVIFLLRYYLKKRALSLKTGEIFPIRNFCLFTSESIRHKPEDEHRANTRSNANSSNKEGEG